MPEQIQSVSILFCCMGNICRSPTAEGVFRHKVAEAGLANRVHIDSAGTHANHVGHAPDQRSQAVAAARGYALGPQRARQVAARDFAEFDFILAMDNGNLAELQRIVPEEYRGKPRLFMAYSTKPAAEIPDPYYGGAHGFELVLDMVEDACSGLLVAMKKELGVHPSSS